MVRYLAYGFIYPLLILLFTCGSSLYAQQSKGEDDPNNLFGEIEEMLEKERLAKGGPLDEAEFMPEYPGGAEAMYRWLNNRIIYPEIAQKHGLEGIVIAQFVVDERGKVQDVAIVQGVGGGCNDQVRKALKKMPEWQPGRQDGIPVRVKQEVRISFFL